MSRTVVDLDEEALSLASEELGTKSKVATMAPSVPGLLVPAPYTVP